MLIRGIRPLIERNKVWLDIRRTGMEHYFCCFLAVSPGSCSWLFSSRQWTWLPYLTSERCFDHQPHMKDGWGNIWRPYVITSIVILVNQNISTFLFYIGCSKISSVCILNIVRNLDNKEKNHEKGFSKQMYTYDSKAAFKKTWKSKLLVRQSSPKMDRKKKKITLIGQFLHARHRWFIVSFNHLTNHEL